MVDGYAKMGDGRWEMEDGRWKMGVSHKYKYAKYYTHTTHTLSRFFLDGE